MRGPKRARSPTRRVSPGCFVSRSREGKKLSRGPPTKSPGRPAAPPPPPSGSRRPHELTRPLPAPIRGAGPSAAAVNKLGRRGQEPRGEAAGTATPSRREPPRRRTRTRTEPRPAGRPPRSPPPPPCPAPLTSLGPRSFSPECPARPPAAPAALLIPAAAVPAPPRRLAAAPGLAAPRRAAPPAGARAAAEAGGLRRGERPRGGGRGAAAVRLKKTGIWRKNGEALAVADPAPSPCCRPVAVAGAGSVRRLPCRRPPGAQRPGGRAGVRASAPRAPSAGGGRPCRKPAARRESRCCGRRRRRAAGFVRRGWKGSLPPAGTGRVRGGISPTGRVPAAWRLRRYEERFQGESPLYSLLI